MGALAPIFYYIKNYYNGAKQHLASWKHREEPIWYKGKL